jgi:acetyl-CoA decarbonylase/synthase complex subunit gamma
VLVLDTQGVNVWCAAGKGTFGTAELVSRIGSSGVAQVVGHRTLVLPQLGAPGVAAHEVSRKSGFRVVYGPVRARDLPAFLGAGMKATPEMRRVSFTLRERLARTLIELVRLFIPAVLAALLFVALTGLGRQGYRIFPEQAFGVVAAVFCNYLAGVVLTPVLLPWLPGRAFACKGAMTGALLGGLLGWLGPWNWMGGVSVVLLSIATCSLLGLMFTGSTLGSKA